MIRFTLKCDAGHEFESWFASSAAFDKLAKARQISCAICGSVEVQKSLMAPRVSSGSDEAAPAPGPLSAPASEQEALLRKMRTEIEAKSENVGLRFAREARAIHSGEAPERPIHGEAKPADARKLLEDGIPVLPLPFLPKDKRN